MKIGEKMEGATTKLMIIILICNAFFIICTSQDFPGQFQCIDDRWWPEQGSNNLYEKSLTYTNEAENFNSISFECQIKQKGRVSFAWRGEPDDNLAILIFRQNGKSVALARKEIGKWILSNISVEKDDKLEWEFALMSKDYHQIWLAFPSQQLVQLPPVLSQNKPPNKPKINISSDSYIWRGNILCISANATDPDNDSIDYIWNWGDGIVDYSYGICSGKNITKCHRLANDGIYTINVTGSNSNGSNSTIVSLSVIPPEPPELLQSRGIGYIDINYPYSAKVDILQGKIRYIFNWSDGTFNTPIKAEVGKEAIANHAWSVPGEHKVKVVALDSQGNPGEYSEEIKVIIYYKKNISNKQDIQYEIDMNSSKYTELVLIDFTYNIGELLLSNKEHLILNSSKNYANLSGSEVENRILIVNSSFIKITRMNISNSTTGIRIVNSSNLSILDNKINIHCCGLGVDIDSGNDNLIDNNTIIDTFDSRVNNCTTAGIAINDAKNNTIFLNKINSSNNYEKICHYYVVKQLNNTIVFPDSHKNLTIIQGDCVCTIFNDHNFTCNYNDTTDNQCMIQGHDRHDSHKVKW